MKVFRVDRAVAQDEMPLHFYGITALRNYLNGHPEVSEVTREWWSGNDLIEESTLTREEIFGTKAATLKAGETIQWAAPRGRC